MADSENSATNRSAHRRMIQRVKDTPKRDLDAEADAYAKEHPIKSFFRLSKDYDPETGFRTGSRQDRLAKQRKVADPDPSTERRKLQEFKTRLKEHHGQKTAAKRTTEEGQRRNERAKILAEKPKGMKKGGMVKKTKMRKKSIDGIARRGKTRARRPG